MKKLMKLEQKMLPRKWRKWRKEASENFLSMRKRFLDPKNLHCKNLAPLPQCIWSGFHYEKADEAVVEDDTEDTEVVPKIFHIAHYTHLTFLYNLLLVWN